MHKKKMSTQNLFLLAKSRNAILPNNSFEIPNENEVCLDYTTRASFLTNSSSICSDNSKSSLKYMKTRRTCSEQHLKFEYKPKRRKVRFTQLEIVNIESYKQYNKPFVPKKKNNGCLCIVY